MANIIQVIKTGDGKGDYSIIVEPLITAITTEGKTIQIFNMDGTNEIFKIGNNVLINGEMKLMGKHIIGNIIQVAVLEGRIFDVKTIDHK